MYALKFSLNDQYKEMLLARRRGLAEGTGVDGALTVLDRIAAGGCVRVDMRGQGWG